MSAYILARIRITDPAAFEEYRRQVPAVIAAHGGRYLVRGGRMEALEGDAPAERVVILEFPDMARLKAFYDSEEYRPLKSLRLASAVSAITAIAGI